MKKRVHQVPRFANDDQEAKWWASPVGREFLKQQPADTGIALRFPVISHGAEFLVQGYLMRRNILTYKAPPNNEGYDLICIHPEPRRLTRQIRIQVKSRYATDSDRGFPVKERTFGAFDFLIVAFLNIGHFLGKRALGCLEGRKEPEFYTFPVSFIKQHHDKSSTWEKVHLAGLNIDRYKGDLGFERIAKKLKVNYPSRPSTADSRTSTLESQQ